MSWDYNLLIEFKEGQSPHEFAMSTALVAFQNTVFKGINSIEIHKGELIKHAKNGHTSIKPIEKVESQDSSLDVDTVKNVLNKVRGDDLLIQMMFIVPRYARRGIRKKIGNSEYTDYDLGDIIHQDENVIISIFGEKFKGYPKDYTGQHTAGAVYDARNGDKYNVRRRGGDALKNLEYVVTELEALAPCGIDTITALDRENSRETQTSSLKFHRDLTQFIYDIWGDQKSSKGITETDVIEAVDNCEDIEYLYFEEGMFIFSKFGVAGNLQNFYRLLASKTVN